MQPPVLTKSDMYRRIVRGDFGNTLPRFFTIRDWLSSPEYKRGDLWGVQHTSIPGFPGTRLNVPKKEVAHVIETGRFGRDFCISPMVTQFGATRWEGDVCRRWDGPGLLCSGNARPAPGSWRTHMRSPKLWQGSAAETLLRTVLNENSYDDLMILLQEYPGHVIELSALDVCFGTVPGRNAVVWEVRRY